MPTQMIPLILAVAAVAMVAIVAGAALAAWRGWLDYKRAALGGSAASEQVDEPEPAMLIEMASVRERLRRLEAIASGVEL